MSRVAVIGAAGYVGLEVCRALRAAKHDVVGVAGANGELLLAGVGVPRLSDGEFAKVAPGLDAVINLAYPTKGSFVDYPQRNRELFDQIRRLAQHGARVIHVSTQAVFGYSFEHPVRPEPVARRRDYAYIEAKIELEHLLIDSQLASALDIVRLGNVWGPASPTWTAALSEKLTFLDPVGVAGVDGFSNVTDVGNVADYLNHLVSAAQQPGPRFHHLAEFSDERWSRFVGPLATLLHVEPQMAQRPAAERRALMQDLRRAVGGVQFASAIQRAYQSPVSGSIARSFLRALPRSAVAALKARKGRRAQGGGTATSADSLFLGMMSEQTQFVSVTDSAWTRPIGLTQSFDRVQGWLLRSGYIAD